VPQGNESVDPSEDYAAYGPPRERGGYGPPGGHYGGGGGGGRMGHMYNGGGYPQSHAGGFMGYGPPNQQVEIPSRPCRAEAARATLGGSSAHMI